MAGVCLVDTVVTITRFFVVGIPAKIITTTITTTTTTTILIYRELGGTVLKGRCLDIYGGSVIVYFALTFYMYRGIYPYTIEPRFAVSYEKPGGSRVEPGSG